MYIYRGSNKIEFIYKTVETSSPKVTRGRDVVELLVWL